MKILIIVSNVGKTAPGIVFEKLIQGLTTLHNIEVLTEDFSPSVDLSKVTNIYISKKYQLHPRISKFFISLFGVDLFDIFWAKKSIKLIKQSQIKHDLVLSFLSYSHYSSLIAAFYYSKKFNVKFAIHTTDAIPPPIGWLEKGIFYNGLKKLMKRYSENVDALFSTNRQMLDFQLKTFSSKENLITNIIYNSGLNQQLILPQSECNCFVYTGGIYGVRKVEYLIKGFIKLLELHPDSELIFVGSTIDQNYLLKHYTHGKIKMIPYTNDLIPYYAKAVALIDIDADIENDVFISSKMPLYLTINRIIISETGKNSPSRKLFNGIKSIIQCDHNPEQLFEAMCKSIVLKNKINFEDRKDIIKLFQIDNIINQLNFSLTSLMGN